MKSEAQQSANAETTEPTLEETQFLGDAAPLARDGRYEKTQHRHHGDHAEYSEPPPTSSEILGVWSSAPHLQFFVHRLGESTACEHPRLRNADASLFGFTDPRAGRTMKVLFFGTYDKERHPRIRSLIEGLTAHGDEVTEVNLPWGLSTAERVQGLQNARLVPGLAIGLLRKWMALSTAGRRADRVVQPDVVIVGYLGHFDVQLARVVFRRRPIVLDHLIFAGDTARDRGTRSRWKLAALDRLDRLALRAADLVLVDTAEHLSLVPAPLRSRGWSCPSVLRTSGSRPGCRWMSAKGRCVSSSSDSSRRCKGA